MQQELTVDEILALNPHIRPSDLERALERLRELEKSGITRRGYTLCPPFSRPRVTTDGGDAVDSRTVSLRHRR